MTHTPFQSAPPWQLAGRTWHSRVLLGTSRYPSPHVMVAALQAAEAQIATVAVRRLNLAQADQTFLAESIFSTLQLLPNTAGCYTARDAVFTAELAREALETDWIKVEVIGSEHTLLPDSVELLEACRQLVLAGFTVLPYCTDDPILCRRLADLGCAAVMPLAAPIGSGLGLLNPHHLTLICQAVQVPVIVDAGLGTASDAAQALEAGATAVLLNTAVAEAADPVAMARAFHLATQAGALARGAGRIPKIYHQAQASSPTAGLDYL